MNTDHLKALAAAARQRNITKAAQELRTSQPALSKQLRKLEETYNVKLFTRSGMGVALTQEGREFLKHAERVLEQMKLLEERFSKRANIPTPLPLKVGGGYAISAKILPDLLALFKKQEPDVDVVLRSNTSTILEQMVVKGALDLVVTSMEPKNPDLVSEPCMRMKVVAIAARGFSLPKKKILALRDLEHIPLIIRSGQNGRGMMGTFFQALRDQGVKPKILMRCDSPEAIKTTVLKKLGVGILYEDVVKDEISRSVFKRVRIDNFPSEAQLFVVYHRHRPLSPAAERFLSILRQRCNRAHLKQSDTPIAMIFWPLISMLSVC